MALLLRCAYVALIAWQVVWLALLPAPAGAEAPTLAVTAILPLLLPLPGVLRLRPRAITWASYLLVLYFLVGVMESWSNELQRAAALIHLGLVCACLLAIVFVNRQQASAGGRTRLPAP